MTGNSMWHLNRVWETPPALLPQQFCCCGVPSACCWCDFSQLSAFCGWSTLKDVQLLAISLCWWLPWVCSLCLVVWGSQTLQMNPPICLKYPCAWFPVGLGRTPLQTCAGLLLFLCKLCVTFAASANITDDLTVTFSVYFFRTTFCYFHQPESYLSFLNIMKNLQFVCKYWENSPNDCEKHKC